MQSTERLDDQLLARWVGWSLLATVVVGAGSSFSISSGIDINLTADVVGTAENMLEAESRLRAKAYIAGFVFALEIIIGAGLFLLLRKAGPLLAFWSLFVSLGASVLILMGAMFAMNAAEIAGDPAYATLANDQQRLLLTGLQATSDYTSFHLGLVITTAANAGFFVLFLRSGRIPKIIAGWGLFASLFVVTAMVARDFIPAIGHGAVTASFMLSNLIALVVTGLYLALRGVQNR